ncbi:hypothetical protein YB2330_002774 [Saitoella coloradoensis]
MFVPAPSRRAAITFFVLSKLHDSQPSGKEASIDLEVPGSVQHDEDGVVRNADDVTLEGTLQLPLTPVAPTTYTGRPKPPGANKVLLIIKTGATVLWDRIPIHLATSLRDGSVPNFLIYSDQEDTVAGVQIHDALVNMSPHYKTHHPDFELYRHQVALRSGGPAKTTIFKGDIGKAGWKLDKYKFVPALVDAYSRYPHMEWYVMVDCDTYIIWQNLVRWLNTLNSSEAIYTGAPTWTDKELFAHGGAGIIMSKALIKATVATPEYEPHRWEGVKTSFGDYVLAKSFKDLGFGFWRAETMKLIFQREPPDMVTFREDRLCRPIMTLHHLDAMEMGNLYEFEKAMMPEEGYIKYADIYDYFIARHLTPELPSWDNNARSIKYRRSDPGQNEPPDRAPWYNKDNCRTACEGWERCLAWRWEDGYCALGDFVQFGEGREGVVSGFMVERIEEVRRRVGCDPMRH